MSSFTSSSKNHHEFESTSTTTKPKRERYHVYLSFCAKDTDSFVSCLHVAFRSKARQAIFLGFDKIGDEDRAIKPSELTVIEEFRTAMIIFSRNYANSRRCLIELEKITECCRTTDGLNVLPFFYDGVYPSYGRLKSGMFGEAFHDFVDRTTIKETSKEEDKLMSWVAAISTTTDKASKFSGSIEPNQEYRPSTRYYHPYTVSLNSAVQDVIQLLKQSKSPLLLGIWGMEGIGKSAIAEAIYHQIGPYFEGMCILHYVGVLLVLDGVDKLEQLKALCGSREWFGAGSKIIITTRDRHLLKEHGVDHIYRVKELDESESLEVVSYCGGWPLALQELGYFLSTKEALEWKDALRSLERFSIPAPHLQETLEKSFRDLSNIEKHIFLDISCFFIGKNKNDVLQTLNRSTQSAAYQISLLEDKSLITTDKNNKLAMHVILQAMAGHIIRKESGYMTKHQ
ncbi:disease resistance protein (TIR-NBS-LRR class), partial [Trifolium pratense]